MTACLAKTNNNETTKCLGTKLETSELRAITRLEGKSNFQGWLFDVEIFFEAGGLCQIVKGEKKKPLADPHEWIKKDGQAKKIIISTINKSI